MDAPSSRCLSSHACAIPGIMATRVIDQKRDRLTTILVAPLTTCSARIPVYTLIISAFVPNHQLFGWISEQGLVMLGLYATGITSALAVAFVIRKVFWRGASEPFLMELPAYKLPDPIERRAPGLAARRDLPAPRRHDHPLDDGDRLGAGEDPAAAAGREGPCHRLQLRRHDRPRAGAAAAPHRLLLADERGADPRHGGPRGGGRRARHGLCGERRRRLDRRPRPRARRPTGHSPRRSPSSPGTSSPRNAPRRSAS